jgi:hypothetical protein
MNSDLRSLALMIYTWYTLSTLKRRKRKLQRSNKLPIHLLNLLHRPLVPIILLQPLRIRHNLRITLLRNHSSARGRNHGETHQYVRRIEFGATKPSSVRLGCAGSRFELAFQEREVDGELLVEVACLNLVCDQTGDGFEEEWDWGVADACHYRQLTNPTDRLVRKGRAYYQQPTP